MRALSFSFALLVLFAGCPRTGGGGDAGLPDAGPAPADAGAPPDTSIVDGPASLSAQATVRFGLESDLAGAGFECSLDQVPFEACTASPTYQGLADGPHTFAARAVDALGRVDATPATWEWRMDLTPPDTRIDAAPGAPVAAFEAPVFDFSADEAATFECRVDGGAWAECRAPWTGPLFSGGPHAFEVRAIDRAGNVDPSPAAAHWTVRDPGAAVTVRIVAANVTSGNYQAYEAPGIRILQALAPDVALVQEMNYASNSDADIRSFVDQAFGTGFEYFREADAQIPNGIVSRYPILESGEWTDPEVSNRDFSWARIDVPGPVDLWAVSLHLLTDGSRRPAEASELVNDILHAFPNIPSSDYLVIGGDLNTKSRTETCINTLGQVVAVSGPYPVDQDGVDGTSASRDHPYDWVLADDDLRPLQVPVVVGSETFAAGLVFDTRVFVPLSDAPPAELGDSGASNMQHMAVVKDFALPQ